MSKIQLGNISSIIPLVKKEEEITKESGNEKLLLCLKNIEDEFKELLGHLTTSCPTSAQGSAAEYLNQDTRNQFEFLLHNFRITKARTESLYDTPEVVEEPAPAESSMLKLSEATVSNGLVNRLKCD